MDIINTIFGVPLGYIIYFAYNLTGSYVLAILIFAIIVRCALYPVSVFAHKNSIRLLQLQPSLNMMKRRYSGNKELLSEEQYNLFQSEKYSPIAGFIPLFIQLFLLLGVLQVMYHPLQHMLHLKPDVITGLSQAARGFYGAEASPFGEQIQIIEAFHHPENLHAIQSALANMPDASLVIDSIINTDLYFWGINLGLVPSIANPSPALLVPLFAGLTALCLCLVQNRISPAALSQSKGVNTGLTLFTVGLSLYFSLVMPAGVGLYWAVGNLLSIAIAFILNQIYPPLRLAGEALASLEKTTKSASQLKVEKQLEKDLERRENADLERLKAAEKQLVFYALTGGQYKYYAEIIEYILGNSDIQIHYVSNDPNDPLFQQAPTGLIPYYASHRKTIGLMLKLDADIVVTTVPDLQKYHLKRSVVRDDIEYIYVFHAITSIHMVYRPGAFDHYDTIFCVGPHHTREIRRSEELYNTKKKNLVKVGYGVIDRLIRSYQGEPAKQTRDRQILIAPSWQKDNIMESCLHKILEQMIGNGYKIVVRPHPEYIKAFEDELRRMQEQYKDEIKSGELVFELGFMESSSMYKSDLLITDWSNTAYEFSFCTKKPVIFVNTPMKVLNPNYKDLDMQPSDIYLRDIVGASIETTELEGLVGLIEDMLKNSELYSGKIASALEEFVYYPKRSGQAGGEYIIRVLKKPIRN